MKRTWIVILCVVMMGHGVVACDEGGGSDGDDCSDSSCNARCLDDGYAGGYCDDDDCRCVDDSDPCDGLDCDDGVDCTRDDCNDGVCSNSPDDSRCSGDEVCNVVDDCIENNPDDPRVAISAEGTYPALVDGIFPTYISHLIGSPDLEGGQVDVASITLTNSSPSASFPLQIEVELLDFSSPITQSVSLSPGETETVSVTPSLDLDALFDLTSSRPGVIRVAIHSDDILVWEQNQPVTISSRNTAFLYTDLEALLAVFVTPHDASGAIHNLLSVATELMPNRSMVGYQPITVTDGGTIPAGSVHYNWFAVADPTVNETVAMSVASSSGSTSGAIYVMDGDALEQLIAGEEFMVYCQTTESVSAGTALECGPLGSGLYYAVYVNYSSSDAWTYTARRTLTHAGIVDVQLEAIYDVLQTWGVRYVNAPADFLASPTQSVYYPAETIDNLAGNCIDGTVLFAAAIEAMGMEPYLLLVPGHAFFGVATWEGSSIVLPLETTMLGTSTYTDARIQGEIALNEAFTAGELHDLNVVRARAAGIRPAPSM